MTSKYVDFFFVFILNCEHKIDKILKIRILVCHMQYIELLVKINTEKACLILKNGKVYTENLENNLEALICTCSYKTVLDKNQTAAANSGTCTCT